VAHAKLYDRKTPITAAELLNDRVLPFYEEHAIPLLRVLTDRGTEYCGNPERHDYELYLAVENIDHTRTKTKSPQTNGICERFQWWITSSGERCANAMSSAISTNSVRRWASMAQPTTRRLKASNTMARYRNPVPVGM